MLWRRRDLPASIAALLLAAGLSACGFHPLYKNDDAAEASAELADVHIDTIRDRNGQILHNFLLDRINAKGQPTEPRYMLSIKLTESKSTLGFIKDSSATLAQLASVATYTLTELKTKKPLQTGRSRSITSYNIVQSDFGTLAAEKDARERTLREISDDITTKVAVFLSSQKRDGGT